MLNLLYIVLTSLFSSMTGCFVLDNVFKRVIEEKFLLSEAKVDLDFENYNAILNSRINFN